MEKPVHIIPPFCLEMDCCREAESSRIAQNTVCIGGSWHPVIFIKQIEYGQIVIYGFSAEVRAVTDTKVKYCRRIYMESSFMIINRGGTGINHPSPDIPHFIWRVFHGQYSTPVRSTDNRFAIIIRSAVLFIFRIQIHEAA